MATYTITSCCQIPKAKWDDYVLSHPKGTVFHLHGMYGSFYATPCHEPLFVAATDESGKILALLCSVRVSISERMASWTSRSLMYVEPICDESPEGIDALCELIQHHDEHVSKETLFSEIRPMSPPGAEREALKRCGYDVHDYFNYLQDLSVGIDAIGQRAKKVKRKVDTALRRGGEVLRLDQPDAWLERVYTLVAHSYQRAKVPLASSALFHEALQNLGPDTVSLRMFQLDGCDVAACVGLTFKDRYFAWYNGTLRPQGLASSAVLVWDEMSEACERGLRYYDFGGAGWPDEAYGPRTFKARFKGVLVNYGRYRKVNSQLKLNVAKCGYRLLRGTIGTPDKSADLGPSRSGLQHGF